MKNYTTCPLTNFRTVRHSHKHETLLTNDTRVPTLIFRSIVLLFWYAIESNGQWAGPLTQWLGWGFKSRYDRCFEVSELEIENTDRAMLLVGRTVRERNNHHPSYNYAEAVEMMTMVFHTHGFLSMIAWGSSYISHKGFAEPNYFNLGVEKYIVVEYGKAP